MFVADFVGVCEKRTEAREMHYSMYVCVFVCEVWLKIVQGGKRVSPAPSFPHSPWWVCKNGLVSLPQPDRLINYPDLLSSVPEPITPSLSLWSPYMHFRSERASVCVSVWVVIKDPAYP